MSEHENENSGHGGGNSGPGNGDNGGGHPGPGDGGKIHIIVDNQPKDVRPGNWLVSDLKDEVGVDAAKVLAEITPTGLVDLEDIARIMLRDGMRFMSHVRKGGSS